MGNHTAGLIFFLNELTRLSSLANQMNSTSLLPLVVSHSFFLTINQEMMHTSFFNLPPANCWTHPLSPETNLLGEKKMSHHDY